ncbi:UNVERIFIED_CONTAM: hypothetical protein Scaly_1666400 [Sesamum calycinum]|uniref:Uncharacterized protein n=1 Tax=Sesamum calycinum TaxID=2727403 RepID=A0AAW2NRU4_9LAMI
MPNSKSNVRKQRITKPDPPCVVCRGSGRVDCHSCNGSGSSFCLPSFCINTFTFFSVLHFHVILSTVIFWSYYYLFTRDEDAIEVFVELKHIQFFAEMNKELSFVAHLLLRNGNMEHEMCEKVGIKCKVRSGSIIRYPLLDQLDCILHCKLCISIYCGGHFPSQESCSMFNPTGRTNHTELAILPKGEWPKWCRSCGGSGLGYCNWCLGTGEYRYIMGFKFMNKESDQLQDNQIYQVRRQMGSRSFTELLLNDDQSDSDRER